MDAREKKERLILNVLIYREKRTFVFSLDHFFLLLFFASRRYTPRVLSLSISISLSLSLSLALSTLSLLSQNRCCSKNMNHSAQNHKKSFVLTQCGKAAADDAGAALCTSSAAALLLPSSSGLP